MGTYADMHDNGYVLRFEWRLEDDYFFGHDFTQGVIDFAGILHDPVAASIRHAFVEHDNPADPFHTVTVGYDALKAALE
jgi:hypothetical protein